MDTDADPAAAAADGCAVQAAALPEPGTEEFAALCRRLDRRPLGYRFVKRAFDIVFSVCAIAVALIPSAILCLFIAADTKDGPIYAQERAGRLGRPFRLFKFRTMVADADDIEKHLTPDQIVEWRRERKVTDDPRITKLGRVLRRTSLDELPQFLNVLVGQMSVIGPRPITYEELGEFGPDAALLCSTPAGITGLWQATLRNDATFESGERQRIELEYVRNTGFRMDAKCFLGTFSAMFGKGGTGK